MPAGFMFFLIGICSFVLIVLSLWSIDRRDRKEEPLYVPLVILSSFIIISSIWAWSSYYNRPVENLGQKSITTIDGIQIIIIDGEPCNLTEHFKRVFDENAKVRVLRTIKSSRGMEWWNEIITLEPLDSNSNAICGQEWFYR